MKPHKKLESMYFYLKEHYAYHDGKVLVLKHSQARRVGKVLSGSIKADGYVSISILDQPFREHRVIFLLCHGFLPDYIDHINQNKIDNRIENLRPASSSQNMANVGKWKKKPSSSFKGVSYHIVQNKWIAHICIHGKLLHIGYFKNEEDAARAYDKKAIELFGDFSCVNF